MEIDKYKELYKLSKELLEDEQRRFTRLETKATQYLAVLTFLIGLSGPLGKTVLEKFLPPTSLLAWLLLNLAVLIFLSLFVTWMFSFWVIKISRLKSCPLNQEVIDFFDKNREIDVYYTMAKSFASAWNENHRVTERKGHFLSLAHVMIRVTVCLVALFTILLFCNSWINH